VGVVVQKIDVGGIVKKEHILTFHGNFVCVTVADIVG
jgi:hypothetical protein